MSLALANVYGPRQDPHGEGRSSSRSSRTSCIAGEPPTINGTGEQTRDFVFVEDVAHAFVRAIENGSGETFNIATGIETTINDLYLVMAEICGFDGAAVCGGRRVRATSSRSALDPSKAKKLLGWEPWTSLRDGLSKTITWFRKNTQPSPNASPTVGRHTRSSTDRPVAPGLRHDLPRAPVPSASRFATTMSSMPVVEHSRSRTCPPCRSGRRRMRAERAAGPCFDATTYENFSSSKPRSPDFTRRCSRDRWTRTPKWHQSPSAIGHVALVRTRRGDRAPRAMQPLARATDRSSNPSLTRARRSRSSPDVAANHRATSIRALAVRELAEDVRRDDDIRIVRRPEDVSASP